MSTKFATILSLFCLLTVNLRICGQTSRERVGLGSPGYFPEPTLAEKQNWNLKVKESMAGNNVLRISQEGVFNVVTDERWKIINGNPYLFGSNLLVLREVIDFRQTGILLAVTNAPDLRGHQYINLLAIPIGIISIDGQAVELWDCGVPYVAPPPTMAQVKESAVAAQQQQALARLRSLQNQTNAFLWLQSQATNGTAADQYSLALHYLNGQGCVTNLELGMYWLKQSAAHGNEEAATKLETFQHTH